MKFFKNKILLLSIILLGTTLRIFWLDKSPPSLNWDEAALGYNAYSLLKTGKDEYGFKFPLSFRSFDDYKPPLYPYITAASIYFFGLNEMSVRLPSAISGVFSIIAIYFIASHIFNKRIGLFSAFFMAIEPWSVHFSRAAFETNLGLSFLLWSIYFALKGKINIKYSYFSILLLFIATFAYHSYRVLFLPLLISYLFLNKNILLNRTNIYKISIFVGILFIPLIFVLKSGGGLVRLESTSILRATEIDFSLKPSNFFFSLYGLFKNIAGRYFAYFSPVNLFIRGTNEPNQKIHNFAIFYTIEFIFFALGLFRLARLKSRPKYLIFLIFIAPLPAIITWNWFLPSRTLVSFSMYSIVIGLGVSYIFEILKKLKKTYLLTVILIFSIILLNNLANLLTSLYFYMPYMEKGNWQYGFREIMQVTASISDNYSKVIFETGHAQPHIFTLFYSNYDPEKYHKEIGCPDCVEKPRKNFNFGKYVFRNIYWPDDRGMENTLFVGSEYSLPENDIKSTKNAKILKDIYDKNGDFIARIVELK